MARNMDAALRTLDSPASDPLAFARQVIETEGRALLDLATKLNDSLLDASALLLETRGSVIVAGIGKAGIVGQKIAATLASTGSRSHFLHAAEAIHGDLGRVHQDDVMLVLSFSGESQEIVNLLPSLKTFGTPLIAITGKPNSSLANAATVVLDIGPLDEACSLGLAPSTSTTAMLAVGDALALTVSRSRSFTSENFARFHPGGSLGRKLARVEDVMRPVAACRIANETDTVRDVLRRHGGRARRTGAVLLVNSLGRLTGLFTDSDLARLFENRHDEALDRAVAEVMTREPKNISSGSRMKHAQQLMIDNKISELPIVDGEGKPVGMIDITDVFGQSFDGAAESAQTEESHQPTESAVIAPPSTVPFPTKSLRTRTSA